MCAYFWIIRLIILIFKTILGVWMRILKVNVVLMNDEFELEMVSCMLQLNSLGLIVFVVIIGCLSTSLINFITSSIKILFKRITEMTPYNIHTYLTK